MTRGRGAHEQRQSKKSIRGSRKSLLTRGLPGSYPHLNFFNRTTTFTPITIDRLPPYISIRKPKYEEATTRKKAKFFKAIDTRKELRKFVKDIYKDK